MAKALRFAFAGEIDVPADAVAIEEVGRQWSYREVDQSAVFLAGRLCAAGVPPGAAVAIYATRTAATVVATVAVARLGGTVVLCDPSLPVARRQAMVERCGCVAVLSSDPNAAPPFGLPVIEIPQTPTTSTADLAWPAPDPARVRYIVHTSGSTGVPKAVAIREGGIVNVTTHQRDVLGLAPDSAVAQAASVQFDAYFFELMMALGSGARLVLPPHGVTGGRRLATHLRQTRATHLVATPSVLRTLAAHELPDLAVVCTVGEAADTTLVTQWSAGRRLLNLYGPAEATIWATWHEYGSGDAPTCIGRTVRGIRAHVLDDRLREVADGTAGQLALSGDNLAAGYHGAPRATAAAFRTWQGARVYLTGDVVRRDPDGRLYFLGRADTQVKVQGARLELGEVEEAVRALPEVSDAVAMVIPDLGGGAQQLAVAYTSATCEAPPAAESAIRSALSAQLPRWMVPQLLVRLDELPRTGSGKADRAAAAELIATPTDAADRALPPAEDSDRSLRRLLEIAGRLLPAQRLRGEDTFVGVGGTSLEGIQFVDQVQEKLGGIIELETLFSSATFRDLATLALGVDTPTTRAEIDRAVPAAGVLSGVSVGQAEMLLSSAGAAAYLQTWTEAVEGRFDAAAFGEALELMAGRHEQLRSRFVIKSHGVVRQTDPTVMLDHRTLVPVDDLHGAETACAEACAEPLDLADAHPLRLVTVQYGINRHLVAIQLHHVVCDDLAMATVLREVWSIYRSGRSGSTTDLAPPTTPYDVFVREERDYLDSPSAARDRAWWEQRLRGLQPVRMSEQALTGDRPGQRLMFEIDENRTSRLDELCRSLAVTPFTVFSAAFTLTLEPWLDGSRCLIGFPCDVRTSDYERTVGAFVNTLPLALRLPRSGSIADWLKNWSDECTAAVAHRRTPLSVISDLWGRAGDSAGQPPLRVVFGVSYNEVGTEDGVRDELRRRAVFPRTDHAKNELVASVSRFGGVWLGQLVHDLRVIDAGAGPELVHRFVESLDAILADTAAPVPTVGLTDDPGRPAVGPGLDLGSDLDFDLALGGLG